jgi:hypothetical protein
MADSVTVLQDVGTSGKKTLAILGDGFAAGSDQTVYNNYVRDVVMKMVFAASYYNEDAAAWNIRRVNLESVDSGASTRTWNLNGTPNNLSDDTHTDNLHNTALNIISNGEWWHNWFEDGNHTSDRINKAINKWAPGADFILIVVNSTLPGGLRTGNVLKVTTQEGWATIAHEFGHGFGNLEDEYSAASKGAYTGSEPARVNVTINTRRSSLKWRQFVNSSTPVPTGQGKAADWTVGTKPAGWDDTNDAGLFEGGATFETGVYRPVINCRMNSNSPDFCPVCYTHLKKTYHGAADHDFRKAVPGRFTSALGSEFIGVENRAITVFRENGTRFEHKKTTAAIVPGSWEIRPGDTYLAADFDGDGRDELVVFNSTDWVFPYLALIKVNTDGTTRVLARYDGDIPGWGGFARHDRLLAGDFDGNGKVDLLIYNFEDWSMPYVATLMSTGTGFSQSRRYDGDIPGWGGLARHDEIFVGDFGGTGHDDLLIWNSHDWSSKYLGLFRMRRTAFSCIRLWENDIPGWGGFAEHDKFIVGDFNGDGKDDLYIFNGSDWANPYLAMFRSTGSDFALARMFDGDVPGWGGMRPNDKFLAADLTGSGRVGLFAWNMVDWSHTYAGRMVSSGTNLAADFREDWVGEWHLGSPDAFDRVPNSHRTRPPVLDARERSSVLIGPLVTKGPDRILVHNKDWLGVFGTTQPLHLNCIYNKWVHNYRFGRNW